MSTKELWEFQKYAIAKYKDRPFFGLLFPCGKGKTLTAIRIAEQKERPVLIIAPDAICEQWEEDIQNDSEKDWNVLVCRNKKNKTKKFKKRLEEFCKL